VLAGWILGLKLALHGRAHRATGDEKPRHSGVVQSAKDAL
jgi:hypothetical protein